MEVFQAKNTKFSTLKQALLHWFSTFGVPNEISSDGGPPFNSADFTNFLKQWNVRHRKSSTFYPQSNGRAEAAVKSAKRILEGNISPMSGQLNTDNASKALLNHRNTPNQETGISPAVALYGYALKDHLPRFRPLRQEWQEILDQREEAMAKRHQRPIKTGHDLQPLAIGSPVQIQNQAGNRPRKWHNTGVVVETLPNRQYKIRVDGSNRVTLRNRKYVKLIDPVCRKNVIPETFERTQPSQENPLNAKPPAAPITPHIPEEDHFSLDNSMPLSIEISKVSTNTPTDSTSQGQGLSTPSTATQDRSIAVTSPPRPTSTTAPEMAPTSNSAPELTTKEKHLVRQNDLPKSKEDLGKPLKRNIQQNAPAQQSDPSPILCNPQNQQETTGSNRPNWRVPEPSRPKRARRQRQFYDASTGEYKNPTN